MCGPTGSPGGPLSLRVNGPDLLEDESATANVQYGTGNEQFVISN